MVPGRGAGFDAGDDGWIYVSSSEIGNGGGGVGALRFNARGEVAGLWQHNGHSLVDWQSLPNALALQQETTLQIPEATIFNGREGTAFRESAYAGC